MNTPAWKTLRILILGWGAIGLVLLLFLDKGWLVLAMDTIDNPTLDPFVVGLTQLAEWVIVVPIGLLLLWFSYKKFLFWFLSYALTGALVQFFKKVVFQWPRPAAWFPEGALTFTDAYPILKAGSFPSGHATTAFFLATAVVILIGRKPWHAILAFTLALGVALSRVYLKVHFFEDVVIGSILGFLLTLWLYRAAWATTGLESAGLRDLVSSKKNSDH